MLYCARAFADDGYRVTISGFDSLQSTGDMMICGADTAIAQADIVVLPVLPLIGEHLNAPNTKTPIRFCTLEKLVGKKPVFCGMKEKLPQSDLNVYDYAKREDFLVRNAVLTAEGALLAAAKEYEGSLFGAKILVCGYGRI